MAFQQTRFLRHLKVLFIAGVSTWLALGEAIDAAPSLGGCRLRIENATQGGTELRIVAHRDRGMEARPSWRDARQGISA